YSQAVSTNRSIVAEQNQAYFDSLKADQEKEANRRREEEARLQALAREEEAQRRKEAERLNQLREEEARKRELRERRKNMESQLDEEPEPGPETATIVIR